MEMAQTTQLFDSNKMALQPSAQVIALDPRVGRRGDSQQNIRILKLSDILSRNLEMRQIIEVFINEIGKQIDLSGYQFVCDEVNTSLQQGSTNGYNANYRLKIHSLQLGEITLFKPTSFTSGELCELEDLLCALLYPLKNAQMYQIALRSAFRDPLTGLNNRTAMEKFLPREIELAKRHRHAMAILVMDLDGFKQINDTYGHDAGDQVLREVGQVIDNAVRNTDLVYRYGGDEFVGGLPQTNLGGAVDVSERIRISIDELDLTKQGISSRIQVSIGITLVRENDNFKRAFSRADKALYQAKFGGKNQIMVC